MCDHHKTSNWWLRYYSDGITLNAMSAHKMIASILLSFGLLWLPLAFWIEKTEFKVWQAPLYVQDFVKEPDRHTPRFTTGTFLPPIISQDTYLTSRDGPIILSATTTIPFGTKLTIAEGVAVVADEFAQLNVQGTLIISGTNTSPVRFMSNELHPENQTWGGVIFTETGKGEFTNVQFTDASPAISCLAGSQVRLQSALIRGGSLGVFMSSKNCQLIDSAIVGAVRGVTAVGVIPVLIDTKLDTYNQPIYWVPAN
jgi:hypothetical protein